MTTTHCALAHLADQQLIAEVKRLATRERHATADLVASLAALDTRKLYLGEGYSSLFTYCTQTLRYSEDAAFSRITAARAAQRFPVIIERLTEGALTLTAVRLLAPHLTADNHGDLLEAARGRSKRGVEEMVARVQPKPDVRSMVRKLPTTVPPSVSMLPSSQRSPSTLPATNAASAADERPAPPAASAAPAAEDAGAVDLRSVAATTAPASHNRLGARTSVVAPLAPERYKVQFTVSAETHARLRQAQELLRHAVPDGDVAAIFDRALVVLLERLERTKWAATKPRERTPRSAKRTRESAGHSLRYSGEIGLSGRSWSHITVTIHQRPACRISWIELMPRAKGFSSLAARRDS